VVDPVIARLPAVKVPDMVRLPLVSVTFPDVTVIPFVEIVRPVPTTMALENVCDAVALRYATFVMASVPPYPCVDACKTAVDASVPDPDPNPNVPTISYLPV
jgi:hypothetical protein